ncbi:uncharacterized protein LOC130815637 [Amaranthus tricolor]|uniref:uncharacterized protein LOC130815637 n=1 Tax=Amaranthus tricolor TaxID=29722 RepID=UPI00258AC83B|nr:uncharacterized protein LOC130815637 [Amaranthus tricolor]
MSLSIASIMKRRKYQLRETNTLLINVVNGSHYAISTEKKSKTASIGCNKCHYSSYNELGLAVLKPHDYLLYKPTPISADGDDERWKPFKNCLGALNGTYTNLSTAHDVRVLRNALSRPNGFRVPRGNYYLVDGGIQIVRDFLLARNIIERCFGLLKGRWSILRSPSFVAIQTQGRIVMACYLLHNLLRKVMPTDDIEEEEMSDNDLDDDFDDEVDYITTIATSDQ